MRFSPTLATLTTLALTAPFGRSVAAQAASETPVAGIRGTVMERAGGAPIDGAVVTLAEASRSATSGRSGAFEMLGVAPGSYALSVRRLGFRPIAVRITIRAGEIIDADMELEAQAQAIEGITVRADSTLHGPMVQVANRMHSGGGGTYLLRAQLDSARGRPVSELLRARARGAHMVDWSAKGAVLIATARGVPGGKRPKADPFDPLSPTGCFCQVYIDGIRVYSPTGGYSTTPDLRQFDAGILEAVEFYPGPAVTPPEFGGDAAMCGTLLLWTRAR